MRLPIRMKMFGLVVVVLVFTIAAILQNTSHTFKQDKELFVREYADRFTSTVARLGFDRIQSFQNKLAIFISQRQSLSQLNNKDNMSSILFERFDDFLLVALIERKSDGWGPVWLEKNPTSTAKTWSAENESQILSRVEFDKVLSEGLSLSKVEQPNSQAAFVLSFPAEVEEGKNGKRRLIVTGILKPVAFEDLIQDFKGDINEVFLVDTKGFVYAHPQAEMIGDNWSQHPLIADISNNGRESSTGESTDKSGAPIIGSYRKVGKTNLYAVAITPKEEAFRAANTLVRNVVAFGAGFVVIALVLAIVFAGLITKPLNELKRVAKEIGSGNFKAIVDIKSKDEVGELATSIDKMQKGLLEREEALEASRSALIQSEKMSAFGQLSAGIAHEVKNPLAGILGHAQLAKTKATDPDIKKHIDVIEKETRRTKEIIENLMKFARAEKAELIPTNMQDTVTATIELVEHQLNLMGVKIYRELKPTASIKANSNQLQQVFLNIMMNAGHAMEKSPTKEITVYTEQVDNIVRVRIKDTGHGMSPEVQKRIFEPFFTTKPAGKGTGLGLSVSFGIVKDHNGKVYVESEVGKGTTFFLDFPAMEGAAQVGAGATVSSSTSTNLGASTVPSSDGNKGSSIETAKASTNYDSKNESTEITSTKTKTLPTQIPSAKTSEQTDVKSFGDDPHTVTRALPDDKQDKNESGNQPEIVWRDYLKPETPATENIELPKKSRAALAAEHSAPSLGGKAPVESDVGPAHPEEKGSGDEDFKVTIRRPKIKV